MLDTLNAISIFTGTKVANQEDPQSSRYYKIKANQNLFKLLRAQVVRKTILHEHQICFADRIAVLVLDLLEAPTNLQGVLAAKKCIMHMLMMSLDAVKPDRTMRRTILLVVKEWFCILNEAPLRNLYDRPPNHGDAIYLSLHIDLWNESLGIIKSAPALYFKYGMVFHQALRQQKIKKGTLLDYVRGVRYVYEFMPLDIKQIPLQELPPQFPIEFLEAAIARYRREKEKPKSHQGSRYYYIVITLLDDRIAKPRPSGYRIESGELEPPDGDVRVGHGGIVDMSHVKLVDIHDNHGNGDATGDPDEEMTHLFEAREADDSVILDEKDLTPSSRPYLNKTVVNHVRNMRLNLPFTARINLFHLSVVYFAISQDWDEEGRGIIQTTWIRLIITYIFILIHTGMDFAQLIRLKRGEGREDGCPVLKQIAGRYYIVQPSFLKTKHPADNPLCEKADCTVYVPLSSPIAAMLDAVSNEHDDVFAVDGTINMRKLTPSEVQDYINARINGSEIGKSYRLKINLLHFKWSFRMLYERRGLSSLLCSYISGRDVCNVATTRAHYIYVTHEDLEAGYLEAFCSIHDDILENLRRSAAANFLSKPDAMPQIITVRDDAAPFDSLLLPAGYGSPSVPKEDTVCEFFRSLTGKAERTKDPYQRHNLLMIYLYYCLQLVTGLRPRNDPPLNKSHFNPKTGTITIADKNSAQYFEYRTLPLPGVITKLLLEFLEGSRLHVMNIAAINPGILYDSREERMIFMIENGEYKPFTLKKMRTCLEKAGIPLNLPANFARHFMRAELYRKGVYDDAADIYPGHQRAGKEMLGVSSSVIPAAGSAAGYKVICDMIERIGIRHVKY